MNEIIQSLNEMSGMRCLLYLGCFLAVLISLFVFIVELAGTIMRKGKSSFKEDEQGDIVKTEEQKK